MNILSWNIRGVVNVLKDSEIKKIIKSHNIHMLGLTETKCREVDLRKVSSLWGPTMCKYICYNALKNNSRGLILAWYPENSKMTRYDKGERWILMSGKVVDQNWMCSI